METMKDNEARNLLDECHTEIDSIRAKLNSRYIVCGEIPTKPQDKEMFIQLSNICLCLTQYLKQQENQTIENKKVEIILKIILDLKAKDQSYDLIGIVENLYETNLIAEFLNLEDVCYIYTKYIVKLEQE